MPEHPPNRCPGSRPRFDTVAQVVRPSQSCDQDILVYPARENARLYGALYGHP